MEKAIIQQNLHWEKPYENLFERSLLKKLILQLKLKEIQVLQGVRRSGKSTLIKLVINKLSESVPPESILYLNLDDPYFSEIMDSPAKMETILENAEKITGASFDYLFLDEIQNLNSWEKFVKSIYDAERFKKIFVAGSNSSLLKKEYARLLTGRYISDTVYPLSFSEYLNVAGLNTKIKILKNKALVHRIIDDMMEYGSFPELVKLENNLLKRELILSYFESIVLKDCIANGGIREIKTFQELAYYLISNSAALFSYNGLAKSVGSNENSVKEFVRILEDSFLIQEIKKFSSSLKNQSRTKKKVYSIDNGILANVSFRFSGNKGKLFENLVYTELLKLGFDVYYYADKNECDFVIKQNRKITAIQAVYELNEQNKSREIKGVKEAISKLNIEDGVIITYSDEDLIEGIPLIPFYKYFGINL